MTNLSTIDDVIGALGGTVAVAGLTGRNKSAVSMWKARKRLPPDTFLVLAQALKRKNCSAPTSLWGIAEPQQRRSA